MLAIPIICVVFRFEKILFPSEPELFLAIVELELGLRGKLSLLFTGVRNLNTYDPPKVFVPLCKSGGIWYAGIEIAQLMY